MPSSLERILSDPDHRDAIAFIVVEVANELIQRVPELARLANEQLTQTTDSENPWIKLAGKYQDDLQYDEVLVTSQ